jgi:putative chitinase
MKITAEQLKKIFPKTRQTTIETYANLFSIHFGQWGLTTPRRVAAFLGQIGWESGELRYEEEQRSKWNTSDPKDPTCPTGDLYENRKNLGNYVPNDGPKFIGRGIIQLTGRGNYTKYGNVVGCDLVKYPERAKEPEWATKIALAYWKDKNLNSHADAWNLNRITEGINGKAKLHLEERIAISERALKVLTEENKNV